MAENFTLSADYFDDVYAKNSDPWDFKSSEYEKDKYATTVKALTRENYDRAFEIGCSIGILTELLAKKVNSLFAIDTSEAPLVAARERLSGNEKVTFQKMAVPDQFPTEKFDLIVASEVLYYLSMEDLEKIRKMMVDHLQPGGQLLLVHWLPKVHDYPLTGDQAHEAFYQIAGDKKDLNLLSSQKAEKYRLDLFEKKR